MDTDKSLSIVLGMAFALVMIGVVAGAAKAAAPAVYTDPIDGTTWSTYEELYQHFITAHPSTPIDIIWQ